MTTIHHGPVPSRSLADAIIAYVDAKVAYELASHELGGYHGGDDSPDRRELNEAEGQLRVVMETIGQS